MDKADRGQRKGYRRDQRYGIRESMKRAGLKAARAARDPRFVAVTAILVACALVAGMNLGSGSSSAATGPKMVRGYVWDMDFNPVADANVTVKSFNGAILVKTLYYDFSEPDGYYAVTFGNAEWDVDNTFEVTACHGLGSAVNSTSASEGPYQWLNVSMGFVIPEFSGGLTVVLTVAGLAAMVLVMRSRRRGSA